MSAPIHAGSSAQRLRAELLTALQCFDIAGELLLLASDADDQTLSHFLALHAQTKSLVARIRFETPTTTAAQRHTHEA